MKSGVRHRKLLLIGEAFLILAVLVLAVWAVAPHSSNLIKLFRSGNVTELEAYLKKMGSEGVWILILLQTIETVSVFLPAVPVYLCAGAICGSFNGILLCWATNLALNVLLFLLARLIGKRLADHGFSYHNEKLERLIEATTKPERVICLICMIPGVPNGLIPYIAARTRISFLKFAAAVAVGSLPTIILFVAGGDLLIDEHFRITVPLVLTVLLLLGAAWMCRKRIAETLSPMVRRFLGICPEAEEMEFLA